MSNNGIEIRGIGRIHFILMACGIECCGMVDGMNVVVGYVVASSMVYQ